MAQEAAQASAPNIDQLFDPRAPRQPDRAHDAAAPIWLPAHAGSVLVGTRSGPEEMRAGVDEAREDAGSAGVDDHGVS